MCNMQDVGSRTWSAAAGRAHIDFLVVRVGGSILNRDWSPSTLSLQMLFCGFYIIKHNTAHQWTVEQSCP